MKFSLKDYSLSWQIWFIVAAVLVGAFTILAFIVPFTLKSSFTEETYARIEESQEYFLQNEEHRLVEKDIKPEKEAPPSDLTEFRVVKHVFITEDDRVLSDMRLNNLPAVFSNLKEDAFEQEAEVAEYSREREDREILYIIRKTEINGKEGYLISYLWHRYRQNLMRMVLWRFLGNLVFILIISGISAFFVTRHLTKPLKTLQQKVRKIAERDWDESLEINRGDEIGRLGQDVSWMKERLMEQDKKQQSFLQQVSHELKNPVMIIKSYVQSIRDGIYPHGDLDSTIEVIEKETERLEQRVGALLNLTKYEYLAAHRLQREKFNLKKLLEEKIEKTGWRRSELNWELSLQDIMVEADTERIAAVFENILDNQIRYAESKIEVNLKIKENNAVIKFWNDGPPIEKEVMDDIFKKYKKGSEGSHGLGLAIVRKIIELHQGEVHAANERGGAAFYIYLPAGLSYKD